MRRGRRSPLRQRGLPQRHRAHCHSPITGSRFSDVSAHSPVRCPVTPVFNGERFIDDALASVAAQRVGRLQIIIVSDASPDNSIAAAEAWRSRLEVIGHSMIVIEHETNAGVAQARNTGIAASTSGLIAFLDQDDLWDTDHLAILHTALGRSGADIALGGVTFVDLNSEANRPWIRDEWFAHDHAGHVCGAVLARRSGLDRIGTFDPSKTGSDDLDWFMRLRDSDVRVVETLTVVLRRRIHETNQSRQVEHHAEKLLAAVRDHLERTR
jgi:glycosyltransferase involved in cell wall biosynthesis